MTASTENRKPTPTEWLAHWHLDLPLLVGLTLCIGLGLFVLYSASNQSSEVVIDQSVRIGIGVLCMLIVAQIPPNWFRLLATPGYLFGLLLLILVLLVGDAAMGARRWLDLGIVQFQPSEIMKIAVPLTVAAWFHERPIPPRMRDIIAIAGIVLLPVVLIANQPDLGTAVLVAGAGGAILYFAGLRWRTIGLLVLFLAAIAPLIWFNMHDYQQERVLTFLNPSRDPTGAGYHIIQSKIAIGSGGLFGKGWLNGTQGHLNFLPESDTDFIFAVFAEEGGFLGVCGLLAMYTFLLMRGLYIAAQSQDTFQRLIAGGLSLTFFIYVFINIGMVAGLLPVVGVPLPLISYGGTSMVVMLIAFGMLMSIHTHRKLLAT